MGDKHYPEITDKQADGDADDSRGLGENVSCISLSVSAISDDVIPVDVIA